MTDDRISHAAPQAGDPRLLNRIAWSLRWSDRDRSVSYATTAAEIAVGGRGARAREERGRAELTLAWQALWRGAFADSQQHALTVESLLRESDFPAERAFVYSILGVIHTGRNRIDLAAHAIERGTRLVDHTADSPAFIDLLTVHAAIQRCRGDRSRAGLTLGRAQALATGADLAHVEHNIARWLLNDGKYETGAEHAETALELADAHQNRVIQPYCLEVLGACHTALGHHDRAETCFRDALDLARDDRDDRAQCQILLQHGVLRRAIGDLGAALVLYRAGARMAARLPYPLWQKKFALEKATVYEAQGEYRKALDQHKRAWKIEEARRS